MCWWNLLALYVAIHLSAIVPESHCTGLISPMVFLIGRRRDRMLNREKRSQIN